MIDERFESQVLTSGGRRIHLVSAGSGPLVVLCHGFPESWYSWRHQLSALAEAGYRAVRLDMRGYGRSSKPPAAHRYRITELVADCVGVVRGLGEEQAVMIGHDWGAAVAWTAAWMRGALYSFSAAPPLPEELADVDFTTIPDVLAPRGMQRPVPRGQAGGGAGAVHRRRPRRRHDLGPRRAGARAGVEVERPVVVQPKMLFYQEYLALPSVPEREFEAACNAAMIEFLAGL